MKYEYKVRSFTNALQLEAILNEYAQEGWRFIEMLSGSNFLIFEREVKG